MIDTLPVMTDREQPVLPPQDAPANPYRREFLWVLGGVGAAVGAGLAGWGALELMVPPGTADQWHKSVCRFCGTGCTIRVGLRDGQIVDIRGHESGHNRGVICVKGSMLRELPRIEGRLTRPMIRKGGKLVEAGWDEALDLVAARFGEIRDAHGPDALAFYGSGQLFTEESYTANKLFKAGLRTNNVDGNPRLCMASAAAGYVSVYGKDEPPGSYEDIDHADVLLLFGANPYECHPPLWERIQRRRAADPRVYTICVDPRLSPTAKRCDLHLPVVPGTDLLLLNAMARVMVEDGLVNRAFVDRHVRFARDGHTVGFDEFAAFLADYTPPAVAGRLGIGADVIRHVAHRFARAGAAMSLWTMGANQRTQGTALNIMLNALHLLTGQIGRPGATPFSITGQPNACGGVRDTGALAHALPGGRQVTNEAHRREVEKLWGVPEGTISPRPGYHAVELFRALEDGRVKGALILCTNPAQSMPDCDRYAAAMDKAFTVVSEIVADSETAKTASVLLPAALWCEKQGVLGQGERRYQLVDKLIDPPGEARPDLWILTQLAERLGLGQLIKARTPQEVWDEWRHMSAHSVYNFEGMTYERLRALPGLQWPCPTEDHPGTVRRYVEGDDPFVSKGAGIEFYGQKDKRAVITLCPYVPSPEQPGEDYPLYLTTGRVLEQWHTGTMTGRIAELGGAAGPARFMVSPADAAARGVSSGDMVEFSSRFGSVRGRAVTDPDLRPGLVFAAFYDARLLVNRVVADHVDPVSKEPEFKLTAVQFRKIRD
ncbi:MAG: nitrate reductase [Planctomycetes bacterium]|nr:nitrate reductase [Planctomycetota bacterium]MCL4729588.1 nitrate reductase [Planctomycetota bacterium]